jgi:hypothetical protein
VYFSIQCHVGIGYISLLKLCFKYEKDVLPRVLSAKLQPYELGSESDDAIGIVTL